MGIASKDTRERAVAAYNTSRYSQQQVGAMFGVHYKTIANWMKADAEGREQILRKRGHLKRILEPEDLEKIDRIMTARPSTTLESLMKQIGKFCSLNVYSRALKELGFTFKKTLRADEQDREGIKKQREEWSEWSRTCERQHLIFIDESAAKTNIAPLRGWARSRCFGSRPGSWKTTTIPCSHF